MSPQKKRRTVIPAVHIFLMKDEHVLLQRRYETGYEDGNYSVPAGHVDGNETVTTAAIREALEEVGVTIEPRCLEMAHVMHRTKPGEAEERVDFFFKVTTWNNDPFIAEPDKCDHICWISVNELPDNTVPYVKFALEQVVSNNRYSEFGWEESN